jgi:predicted metal-dependent peptidase
MPRKKSSGASDAATASFQTAYGSLGDHPLFSSLLHLANVIRDEKLPLPKDCWATISSVGHLHVHPTRRATIEEWTYVLAHCLLHLGLGHFRPERRALEWNAACDVFVTHFLDRLKIGRPPDELLHHDLPGGSEEHLYDQFCRDGIPDELADLGTAGADHLDMINVSAETWRPGWDPAVPQRLFAQGLVAAVQSAVSVAAGRAETLGSAETSTAAQRARSWFISSYPLLGAVVAAFDIIEDPLVCSRQQISIAAVNPTTREIFMNRAAALAETECRFVMAHEILHVGLDHDGRCQGRDPYLWNIACDFVVNGWLMEMEVGQMPDGLLHDLELTGLSAESVYDRIVTDMRRYRKLATLRGAGLGEVMGPSGPRSGHHGHDLEDFYRRALAQGLEYHLAENRGYLPAGLIEEIRALSQPPIPWDVELAQWFDDYFDPLEKTRSYARPSRRQASTPDIPRPRYVPSPGSADGRTFGVVLDTSGSMERQLLAKALGAIASYSMARDVPAVRVVFCDAAAYDQGYMPPEAIADRVKVRGRGGTVLQPGIDLLQNALDFPKEGPILIITDCQCDRVIVRRLHAFLVPRGSYLPFVPKGPVFRIC